MPLFRNNPMLFGNKGMLSGNKGMLSGNNGKHKKKGAEPSSTLRLAIQSLVYQASPQASPLLSSSSPMLNLSPSRPSVCTE
jgi:hypothetical protein